MSTQIRTIKQIVLCSSYTVPYPAGGGLNAFNLAKALLQDGKAVKLFTYNWGGRLKSKEKKEGVHIIRVPFLPERINDKKIKFLISFPILTLWYIKTIIPSKGIIFFGTMNSVPMLLILIALAKGLGKKVMYRSTMLAADDISSLLSFYPGFWTKYILGKIDVYYAISPAFTASFLRCYRHPERVVETFQGVNTDLFYPVDDKRKSKLRNELALPEGIPIIVSVGYVYDRKGYKDMFEVLSTFNTPFLYMVVGEYTAQNNPTIVEEKKQQMAYLYDYGRHLLKDKVLFLGKKDNVSHYLQASDIFLINSVQEGVPNVLLEAMACGLGIVSNEMEGVYNTLTIPGKNALIFKDNFQMAESVTKMLLDEHYRKQLGKAASFLIHSKYSLKTVAHTLADSLDK